MSPEDMSFTDLYTEMVKKGILPQGRNYIEKIKEKENDLNEGNHTNNAPGRM